MITTKLCAKGRKSKRIYHVVLPMWPTIAATSKSCLIYFYPYSWHEWQMVKIILSRGMSPSIRPSNHRRGNQDNKYAPFSRVTFPKSPLGEEHGSWSHPVKHEQKSTPRDRPLEDDQPSFVMGWYRATWRCSISAPHWSKTWRIFISKAFDGRIPRGALPLGRTFKPT